MTAIKKALLVPTVVFLAAVAVMVLGLFLVVVPVTLMGLEEHKQTVRDFLRGGGYRIKCNPTFRCCFPAYQGIRNRLT